MRNLRSAQAHDSCSVCAYDISMQFTTINLASSLVAKQAITSLSSKSAPLLANSVAIQSWYVSRAFWHDFGSPAIGFVVVFCCCSLHTLCRNDGNGNGCEKETNIELHFSSVMRDYLKNTKIVSFVSFVRFVVLNTTEVYLFLRSSTVTAVIALQGHQKCELYTGA